MSDLDALLAGIVADPRAQLRWLVLADWLEEFGEPCQGELLRLHRWLLDTCADPDAHPARGEWHDRMMELLRTGVRPCVPQHTLQLPGGVPLTASFVPPGTFRMGRPPGAADRELWNAPPHTVTLTRGMYVGMHPVTQGQWQAVTGGNPSWYARGVKTGWFGRRSFPDLSPVESVGWDDAKAFCTAAAAQTGGAVRLLTEAEWEYAARAGTTTHFHWGDELNGTQANCNGEVPYGTSHVGPARRRTTPVGAFERVAPHPWGLRDMAGNVWEWCEDQYDDYYYTRSPAEDPVCRDGDPTLRVVRGGSYDCPGLECRLATRGRLALSGLDESRRNIGFRVCYTAEGERALAVA